MNAYIERVIETVKKKHGNEPEFVQTVEEVLSSLDPIVEAHPEYEKVTVKCACGAEFKTRSTKKDIRLDICSKCHPFFTGKQKLVDTGGRVDRFKKRFNIGE